MDLSPEFRMQVAHNAYVDLLYNICYVSPIMKQVLKMPNKVLANIWEPVLEELNKKIVTACLRRDSYLNQVFRHEIQVLDQEIKEPNSAEARTYISKHLSLLRRKPVVFLLDSDVYDALNTICTKKNVPRDAFINRVLLMLVTNRMFFRKLIEIDWDWAEQKVLEDFNNEFNFSMMNGSLNAINSIIANDPFWFVRQCIHVSRTTPSIYTAFMDKDCLGKLAESAIGFNCHLDNALVDGHSTKIKWDLAFENGWQELTGGVDMFDVSKSAENEDEKLQQTRKPARSKKVHSTTGRPLARSVR